MLPLWFYQVGVMAMAFATLVYLFTFSVIVQTVIAATAAVVLYYSFYILYRVYGPDRELEEFLEEMGLGDEKPELTPWDVKRKVLIMFFSGLIFVFAVGPLLVLKAALAAVAAFILWSSFQEVVEPIKEMFGIGQEFDFDEEDEDPDDYRAPQVEGFEQFEAKKH